MDLLPDLIRYSSIIITTTVIWYLTFRRSSIYQFSVESTFEPLTPRMIWRKILSLYLITRLLLAGTFVFYVFGTKEWKKNLDVTLTKFFYHYDSPRYINIAETGYHAVGKGQENIAFYPLYPYLVRIVHYFIPHYTLAAILVSNAFLLVGLYYLVRLA